MKFWNSRRNLLDVFRKIFRSMSERKWKKNNFFAMELFSSELTFGNLKCSSDNLPKKNAIGSTFFGSISDDEKQREFSFEKLFPPRNVPIDRSIAVLTNLPKICRQETDIFAQCPEREKNQFFPKKIVFSKHPFGRVESNFDKPAVKKWPKTDIFLHKYWKWLKNSLLSKIDSQKSFWKHRMQFRHLFRNNFERRPTLLAQYPKKKKQTDFYQNQNLLKKFL